MVLLCFVSVLQEMGENFSPYGPYRFIYGPYKISPTTQEVPQQKGDNSPRQGQVYGPYRILYGPYKLFRKPRLELETETAGEAEKESFQDAISGIKREIPDLILIFCSFLVLGRQGRTWRRRRRSFTTDLQIFYCFSMNSFITFIVLSFENMSS